MDEEQNEYDEIIEVREWNPPYQTVAASQANNELYLNLALAAVAILMVGAAVAAFNTGKVARAPETLKAFLSGMLVWGTIVVTYVLLAEPYGSQMYDDDYMHLALSIVLPPVCALLAFLWWRRFVQRRT